jgi:hypothetical protein
MIRIRWRRLQAVHVWVAIGGAVVAPDGADAQFTDPCSVECALTAGATSYLFATGTSTAVGRLKGGFSTQAEGVTIWVVSFAAAAGTQIALWPNGARQERVVYGGGLGALAGAVTGLVLGSALGDDDASTLAATLMGTALGAAIGGAIGAVTFDDRGGGGAPLFVVRYTH